MAESKIDLYISYYMRPTEGGFFSILITKMHGQNSKWRSKRISKTEADAEVECQRMAQDFARHATKYARDVLGIRTMQILPGGKK